MIVDNSADLPDGWILTTLGDLGSWSSGGTPSRTESQYYNGDIPWIKTGDLSDGLLLEIEEKITAEGIKNSSAKIFPVNSLVVAMYGATIGRLGILKIPAATNQACGVLLAQGMTDQLIQYLFYYLLGSRETLRKIGKGGAQPNISQTLLKEFPCPLPPLNEQRRIVSSIEQLTDRSHKARAALEDVPKLIAQFRQSVLAAAFRGDLTADWREKNPDDEWQTTILDEIIHGKPRNGYSPKPVNFSTNVKSLTLSSTTSGIFKPEHFKYINEDISKDSYLWLIPGDILLQRGNTLEYVGTSAIYTGELFEFIYPDLMIKLQIVKEKALPEFIHYQLSSEATRKYFKSNATGTAGNMPKINQKIVMETPIFLPSLKEQLEIMKKIKKIFDGIELLKNVYMESEEELNQLDRSILAKAFRGELVPQDPNDEPAAALLERIRAERDRTSTPKQRGKTTRKNSSKQLSIDLE